MLVVLNKNCTNIEDCKLKLKINKKIKYIQVQANESKGTPKIFEKFTFQFKATESKIELVELKDA
jgi:hypothetical protein